MQELKRQNEDLIERCNHLENELKSKNRELDKLKRQQNALKPTEKKQREPEPKPAQKVESVEPPSFNFKDSYSEFRWRYLLHQNERLLAAFPQRLDLEEPSQSTHVELEIELAPLIDGLD